MIGTETDFFAGYRACPCLEGHYRTHLFDKCLKCQSGLVCQDDYALLEPGYWWQWRNYTYKHRYEYFIKNVIKSSPALDNFSVQYPYPIPIPYRCQVKFSRGGGLNSSCRDGYRGPICAVCSPGYHKQFHSCKICPSRAWITSQLLILASILILLFALLVWRKKTNLAEEKGLQLMDNFLSKLKILIGFYQVTHGFLDVFSYIEWPDSLQVVSKYSGLLQINLLQIAPIHCLFQEFHVDAFGDLFVILSINAIAIVGAGVIYGVRKIFILRITAAYIFALPAVSLFALWRHRKLILTKGDGDDGLNLEVLNGVRFLFENYKPRSWYWELVEMSRKFILTSGLILVGQESRSCIGLAWVIAGMYAVLFCWIKPMQDPFENKLMSTSLAVTIVNLGIGAVSRIPAENISDAVDHHKDALAMKILILGANALVIGLLVGKIYLVLRKKNSTETLISGMIKKLQ